MEVRPHLFASDKSIQAIKSTGDLRCNRQIMMLYSPDKVILKQGDPSWTTISTLSQTLN
jgi:hypothetical protein